ncbi:MAG: DMT family transporter [Ectothiorhodospiraceae bacterium]|nr:DMT family transporter [Ectothiorhodospiraceae bacterium]
MLQQRSREMLAYTGVVCAALFWAGNAVVARGVIDTVPPMALSFWRWMVAFAIIVPFSLPYLKASLPVIRRHWRILLVLSFLSAGMFNTLQYLAAHTTTAVNITLVNSTMPIMIGIFAFLWLGERPGRRQVQGILIALAGILVVISRGSLEVLASIGFAAGDLLMVLAIACWGFYSVLLKRYGVPLHPVMLITVIIAMALPITFALYLFEMGLGYYFPFRAEVLPPVLYVGIFPALLSYLGWNYGVTVLGPSRAAIFIYLMPLFAAVLATVFLQERLHVYHAAGGLLILVGLYLATRAGPRAMAAESPAAGGSGSRD